MDFGFWIEESEIQRSVIVVTVVVFV